MKVDFYSDSGHGWLKVSFALLLKMGIQNKISGYSYIRNGSAYLEEDCDANIFINAYKKMYGDLNIIEHNTNGQSKIRRYAQYQAA